jgi:mono/diheme cytochrome c family protein
VHRLRTLVAVVLMPCTAATALAEEAGNQSKGLEYARSVCGECHAVEGSDEFSPNPDAPSFVSVANTPGMSERALIVWLQSSHPTMPNIMVPVEDRDNVVAYIMSLRETSH